MSGANVDLTVVSIVADTHDVTTVDGDHAVALGHIRCEATNSHETYRWTVDTHRDAPRIGDIVKVRMGDVA